MAPVPGEQAAAKSERMGGQCQVEHVLHVVVRAELCQHLVEDAAQIVGAQATRAADAVAEARAGGGPHAHALYPRACHAQRMRL